MSLYLFDQFKKAKKAATDWVSNIQHDKSTTNLEEGEIIYCKNNVCVHPPTILRQETEIIHHPGYLTIKCQHIGKPFDPNCSSTDATYILTWIPNDTLRNSPSSVEKRSTHKRCESNEIIRSLRHDPTSISLTNHDRRNSFQSTTSFDSQASSLSNSLHTDLREGLVSPSKIHGYKLQSEAQIGRIVPQMGCFTYTEDKHDTLEPQMASCTYTKDKHNTLEPQMASCTFTKDKYNTLETQSEAEIGRIVPQMGCFTYTEDKHDTLEPQMASCTYTKDKHNTLEPQMASCTFTKDKYNTLETQSEAEIGRIVPQMGCFTYTKDKHDTLEPQMASCTFTKDKYNTLETQSEAEIGRIVPQMGCFTYTKDKHDTLEPQMASCTYIKDKHNTLEPQMASCTFTKDKYNCQISMPTDDVCEVTVERLDNCDGNEHNSYDIRIPNFTSASESHDVNTHNVICANQVAKSGPTESNGFDFLTGSIDHNLSFHLEELDLKTQVKTEILEVSDKPVTEPESGKVADSIKASYIIDEDIAEAFLLESRSFNNKIHGGESKLHNELLCRMSEVFKKSNESFSTDSISEECVCVIEKNIKCSAIKQEARLSSEKNDLLEIDLNSNKSNVPSSPSELSLLSTSSGEINYSNDVNLESIYKDLAKKERDTMKTSSECSDSNSHDSSAPMWTYSSEYLNRRKTKYLNESNSASPATIRLMQRSCQEFSVDLGKMRSLKIIYKHDDRTSGQLVIASRENQYKILYFERGGLDQLARSMQDWNKLKQRKPIDNCQLDDVPYCLFTICNTDLNDDDQHPEEGKVPKLTNELWSDLLNERGHIKDPDYLRKSVFFNGLPAHLRRTVWPFLLHQYSYDSTFAERERINEIRKLEYQEIIRRRSQIDGINKENFIRNVQCVIEKDVVRTDRHNPFYAGDDNPNLEKMTNILLNYAVYDSSLGYLQGMSDLLAPLLAEINDESESFWCFCGLMQRRLFVCTPTDADMEKNLRYLRELIRLMVPRFYDHLQEHVDAMELLFCHRWILLCFKREFPNEIVFQIWEACWSNYLIDYFHLFVCLAILDAYAEDVINQDLRTDEMLLHFSSLSMCMDGALILRKARWLLHKFRLRPVIPCSLAGLCQHCGPGMWDSFHTPSIECQNDVKYCPETPCPHKGSSSLGS